MELMTREPGYAVLCKQPGEECEHQLPALLAERLGGSAQDYRCVHRLDRAVGGVMIYARTPAVAAALSEQLRQRRFGKRYLAVCAGCPAPDTGEMRDYLYKDAAKGRAYPVKRPRRGVKEAVLEYRVLDSAPSDGQTVSLLDITLHTGRFHQIRAQCAARGHSLLGDGRYGSRIKGCTVALFCRQITFVHPDTGERLAFDARPADVFPWDLFDGALYAPAAAQEYEISE